MRELTPLTCLAILTFEAPTAAACPNDEHAQLIDAIEAGAADHAAALMVEHLDHIEHSLRLQRGPEPEVDLAAVLLGWGPRHACPMAGDAGLGPSTCSACQPSCSTRASAKRGPAICRPTGRPWRPLPQGSDSAGRPP